MHDQIAVLNEALEGAYRIEREIGAGGMATVYLADDLKHERKVALKVLKPELAAVVGADRFLTEIKTTANLQHPHILPLFDSGQADGFLFYVMPYIDGETLRDRLNRERQLPVDEALALASSVAHALHAAHERGIVHRDIKPGNILLSNGQPLVADFGIALAVGSAGGGRLTETGLSVGTPFYMSPEQATGDQVIGPASDTYSLACVLFEMLTGEPPYPGSTAQAVLGKIIQGVPVSATSVRRSVPPHVDAAIRKALEKLPADRFSDARDFARALGDRSFRHGDMPGVAAGAVAARWKPWALVTTASTVALAAWMIWSGTRPEAPGVVARFEIFPAEGQTYLPSNLGVDYRLSPDGQLVVYVALDAEGTQRLWERRLDDVTPRPIPGTEDARNPVFSPDGQSLAFRQETGIKTVSLLGGPTNTVLREGVGGSYFDWGSDGMIYFTPSAAYTEIHRVPVTGGEPEGFTLPREDAIRVSLPHVLPDEKGVLVTLRRSVPGDNGIAVVGPDGGEVREILTGVSAQYARSGHIVYATVDNTLMAAPFDVDRLEVTGPSVAVLDGIAVRLPGPASQFSFSETGTFLYRRGRSSTDLLQMLWVSRSGDVTPIDDDWTFRRTELAPGWSLSPDGSRLAIAITTDDNEDIWIKELPNGSLTRLTFDPDRDTRPRWSPDGTSIAFISERSGTWELWSKAADGTGQPEVLYDSQGAFGAGHGHWSNDGEWLVLYMTHTESSRTSRDVFALRPGSDSDPIPLLTESFHEAAPALSPDGRWIAYVSDETGSTEIFVRPFPNVEDGKFQVSTGGGRHPTWTPDGRELVFRDGNQTLVSAGIETEPSFRRTSLTPLFPVQTGTYYFDVNGNLIDVSPDGQRILLAGRVGSQQVDADRLVLVQNFFEVLRERVPN